MSVKVEQRRDKHKDRSNVGRRPEKPSWGDLGDNLIVDDYFREKGWGKSDEQRKKPGETGDDS